MAGSPGVSKRDFAAADQVYMSAVNTTPQHMIRISVQAKTGELLAELDKKLRAAGYEVKPLSITPATDSMVIISEPRWN